MNIQVNRIPEEYRGVIFLNGDTIGRFENVMELLDFRIQIAQGHLVGYTYKYDLYDDIITIDDRGGVSSHPDMNCPANYTRRLYNLQLNDL